jgi:hypothetical protein
LVTRRKLLFVKFPRTLLVGQARPSGLEARFGDLAATVK